MLFFYEELTYYHPLRPAPHHNRPDKNRGAGGTEKTGGAARQYCSGSGTAGDWQLQVFLMPQASQPLRHKARQKLCSLRHMAAVGGGLQEANILPLQGR